MTAASNFLATLCSRLGLGLAVLVLALWAPRAMAVPLDLETGVCHATSGVGVPDGKLSPQRFSCSGTPTAYQQGSLWLRAPLDGPEAQRGDVALMVHQSRFDRLAVGFSYADGVTRWEHVEAGDYGSHWRVGGQILFDAPDRSAPLTSVTMRFDRLASHQLLHARMVPKAKAGMQSAGMAAAVG
ncbi:MAG: GGDEF domain-containing protein, partial [Sphingopyxis sp.]|nr:GGDEF domain-containing protein [Sphingopyxis sp.]